MAKILKITVPTGEKVRTENRSFGGGDVLYVSPFGGLTNVENGKPVAVVEEGGAYAVDGDTGAFPSLLYIAPSGGLTVDKNGKPVDVLRVPVTRNSPDVVVTVGDGGDYSNLGEALSELSALGKRYFGENPQIDVVLQTGFALDQQIICDGIHLNFATIKSVDPEVSVIRSALKDTNIINLDYSSRPVFLAVNRGALPNIGALFNMDSSGTADPAKHHGFMAAWNGAVHILQGAGMKNVPGRAAYGVRGEIYARAAIFDNAGRAIRMGNASIGNFRECSAQNATEYGIAIGGGSVVTATDLDVSGSATGALVDNASALNADNLTAVNCTVDAVVLKHGSRFNGISANLSGAGNRALDSIASYFDIENANLQNAGSTPLVVNKASVGNAQNVDATTTGNTVAVSCTASKLNFKNGTASSTGGQPIRVFDGGDITATNATGGLNVTPNTVTANGVIYQ